MEGLKSQSVLDVKDLGGSHAVGAARYDGPRAVLASPGAAMGISRDQVGLRLATEIQAR